MIMIQSGMNGMNWALSLIYHWFIIYLDVNERIQPRFEGSKAPGLCHASLKPMGLHENGAQKL